MFENPVWGARLMWWDVPMLVLCALGTAWLWPLLGSLALLCPMVFLHFLLFCNIVRLRTRMELVWAASFLVNVTVWLATSGIDVMGQIALVQLPITALLVAIEARSWRYHGIFADRINPSLDRYIAWVAERRDA